MGAQAVMKTARIIVIINLDHDQPPKPGAVKNDQT
jgi:hypothetical protein